MPEETFEQFTQWLAKAQQQGRRKRLDEAPAPGMRPDRFPMPLAIGLALFVVVGPNCYASLCQPAFTLPLPRLPPRC